jgi:hypothetical protein
MWYAIVTHGLPIPGPKVFRSLGAAKDHLSRVRRDSHCDGRYAADRHSLSHVLINEYKTRRAANRGDITDGCYQCPGQNPGFVRIAKS